MNISIHQLKKNFGDKTAVNIPDFSIAQGEIIGLVGNNGAGKTTLFRLILDLVKADEGHILLTPENGKTAIDPSKSIAWKHFTGAYLEEAFLIDFLTPEEYFDFVAKVSNIDCPTLAQRLAFCQSFMGDEILGQHKYIRDYSSGNRQKIGIVAALIHQPSLVILDEPFNFLDPSSQNQLKRLLADYCQHTHATILLSSHNLQHTIDISTRIALMEHGAIIKDLQNTDASAAEELESYFER